MLLWVLKSAATRLDMAWLFEKGSTFGVFENSCDLWNFFSSQSLTRFDSSRKSDMFRLKTARAGKLFGEWNSSLKTLELGFALKTWVHMAGFILERKGQEVLIRPCRPKNASGSGNGCRVLGTGCVSRNKSGTSIVPHGITLRRIPNCSRILACVISWHGAVRNASQAARFTSEINQ